MVDGKVEPGMHGEPHQRMEEPKQEHSSKSSDELVMLSICNC